MHTAKLPEITLHGATFSSVRVVFVVNLVGCTGSGWSTGNSWSEPQNLVTMGSEESRGFPR